MTSATLTELPPYTGSTMACWTCGPAPTTMPLDKVLDEWEHSIYRNGELVWNGFDNDATTLAHFDAQAELEPGDWRLHVNMMLRDLTYQRQSTGWVLVAKGQGYA